MFKIFSIAIILLLFIPNCEKADINNCIDAVCTAEFRGIGITIKHLSDDSPVILTSYNVFRTSDNVLIKQNISNFDFTKGFYNVVDDTMVDQFYNSSFEIEFKGYINDSLVITNKLKVKFTCCHVYYVSGDLLIYI
jgi:hypothetical protein